MPIDIEIVDLTDYTGQNADTARTAIAAAGFTVEPVWERHDTVAAGLVISQAAGASGDAQGIRLTISIGGYSAADRAAIMAFGMAMAASSGDQARPNTMESIGL